MAHWSKQKKYSLVIVHTLWTNLLCYYYGLTTDQTWAFSCKNNEAQLMIPETLAMKPKWPFYGQCIISTLCIWKYYNKNYIFAFSIFLQCWNILLTRINFNVAWITNYIHYNVWDEITYPFPNFNGTTIEVWKWISNFIPHFPGEVITYPCWDQS